MIMTEKEVLISHARELKEKCAEMSVVTFTNFLTIEEKSSLSVLKSENSKYVNTFYYGGYSEAERCVAVFVPEFYKTDSVAEFFKEYPEENPLAVIKAEKDKFTNMTHRDFLGSLMALGLKREMLGDIIVTDYGCCFFCLKNMASFIVENLKRTGRGSVECKIIDFSELPDNSDKCEYVFSSLPSLRLDAVVSAAFSLSRSKSSEFISKGVVYVNDTECLKNDMTLDEGSKIVLRGKGKVILNRINGLSKKGRIHAEFKKFK